MKDAILRIKRSKNAYTQIVKIRSGVKSFAIFPYVLVWGACLFLCLFVFYGKSIFVGYLMLSPFCTNKQFYFKQLSLA